MRFKITNTKYNDSLIIEGETIQSCVEENTYQLEKRGWKREDCFSEKLE